MRVLIVSNQAVLPGSHPEADAERAVEDAVAAVQGHLAAAGFEVECLSIGRDWRNPQSEIERRRPDVVFNLFEGLADDPRSEIRLAEAIESLGVPLTGASSPALRLAGDKWLAKQALTAARLPTPKALVVDRLPIARCELCWPVIAKPALFDASHGIDQGSVVVDLPQLARRVGYLLDRYDGGVLVEEFLEGREFSVTVVELPTLRALPAMETRFLDPEQGFWPLLTYDAKWKPDSRDYRATPLCHAAGLPARLAEVLENLALRAFRALGCRDYARIDLRLDAGDCPYILEVNPNPDVSPTACLTSALAEAGFAYPDFTIAVTQAAWRRGGGV